LLAAVIKEYSMWLNWVRESRVIIFWKGRDLTSCSSMTVLSCLVIYCIVLYCIVLYFIVLSCIVHFVLSR
jgi:hypothetical protein